MDMYDSLFSPDTALAEQVAGQLFEILSDCDSVIVVLDKAGNFWSSNSEKFDQLKISELYLQEFCGKIDDGQEPVVTQLEDYSLVGLQLATERTNCGYVIIVLPEYSPESTLANIDLIEVILKQTTLVAKLIEKNNLLYELQLKHYSANGGDTVNPASLN